MNIGNNVSLSSYGKTPQSSMNVKESGHQHMPNHEQMMGADGNKQHMKDHGNMMGKAQAPQLGNKIDIRV
ncbi:MAG: hypothetical protein ACOYVK_14955 [Bacillota bacterium]